MTPNRDRVADPRADVSDEQLAALVEASEHPAVYFKAHSRLKPVMAALARAEQQRRLSAPVAPQQDVTKHEREVLHELISDMEDVIDPEEHGDLCERATAVLKDCDGGCVPLAAEPSSAPTSGGETQPASRSRLKREAVQRGEPLPTTFPDAQPASAGPDVDEIEARENLTWFGPSTASSRVPAPVESLEQPADYEWALARVQQLMASAYADARVHGLKLLKGFGYPDEVMCRAQDYRALHIVLEHLAALQRARETPGATDAQTEER